MITEMVSVGDSEDHSNGSDDVGGKGDDRKDGDDGGGGSW